MRIALTPILAAALLSGCAASSAMPLTATSRYTLQVEPGVDRIALSVHDTGLSSAQQAALRDLAGRWAASGASWLTVEAPAGNDPAAGAQAYAAQSALAAAGVPAERIQIAAYAAPDPRAPVLAGFEIVRAAVPNCAAVSHAAGAPFTNSASPAFGCAVTANMAAQIANPRDILGAQPMTPTDSGRAAVVFDKYRKGENASTPQERLVEGRVSQAVD